MPKGKRSKQTRRDRRTVRKSTTNSRRQAVNKDKGISRIPAIRDAQYAIKDTFGTDSYAKAHRKRQLAKRKSKSKGRK